MLYLGSDNLIPIDEWNQENPKVAFNDPVMKPEHFSKANVYFVNSTECCGCGFKQKIDVQYVDLSESENKSENQSQLHKHISKFLESENFIELFGCWAGSENDLETKREVQISELIEDDFYFAENELVIVKK